MEGPLGVLDGAAHDGLVRVPLHGVVQDGRDGQGLVRHEAQDLWWGGGGGGDRGGREVSSPGREPERREPGAPSAATDENGEAAGQHGLNRRSLKIRY